MPDLAPYFVSYNPAPGSVVTSPVFEITASDPNVADTLFVHWAVDFPPSVSGKFAFIEHKEMPIPNGPDGRPRIQSTGTPACFAVPAPGTFHRITVIVADQPFGDTAFDSVTNNGLSVSATWIWNVTCPPRAP